MEFNFQKPKTPAPFDFQISNIRNRNQNESKENVSNSDTPFNATTRFTDFNPTNNSCQFPQFMFGESSPRSSNDNNFLHTTINNGKNEIEKQSDFFKRRPNTQIDAFFATTAENSQSSSSTQLSSNDLPSITRVPSNFAYQQDAIRDKGKNIPAQLQKIPVKSAMTQNEQKENLEMHDQVKPLKEQVDKPKCSSLKKVECQKLDSNKDIDITQFCPELDEFSNNYTKLSIEKTRLEIQNKSLESSLKECREQSLNFQNMYEDMKEKLEEELKNREAIESQIIYINTVSEAVQGHCKDISNTLQLYKDINNEHTERHSKQIARVDNLKEKYEEVLQNNKVTIEILKKEVSDLEEQLKEKVNDLRKMEYSMNSHAKDSSEQLAAEKKQSSILEQSLTTAQENIKELNSQFEMFEKSSSQKYTSLYDKFVQLDTKYKDVINENNVLKTFKTKCNELELHIGKVQEEKKGLFVVLETSQQNIIKFEKECTLLNNDNDEFKLQLNQAKDTISKLEEEVSNVNTILFDERKQNETLMKEAAEFKLQIQSLSEIIEVWKAKQTKLDSKIEELEDQLKENESIISDLKKEIGNLIEKLSDTKSQVISRDEEKHTLESKISALESQLELLQTKELELITQVSTKEKVISEHETEIANIKLQLEKVTESKNTSDQKLLQSTQEMERIRQEMMYSVDQYREQYLNELKENEDKRKELQHKYESLHSELEKVSEEKSSFENQSKDLLVSNNNHKENINKMNETIQKLKNELDKEQKLSKRKKDEQNEQSSELKKTISKLQEEKTKLTQNISILEEKLERFDNIREEKEALEKHVEVLQIDIDDLRAKTTSSSFPRKSVISAPIDDFDELQTKTSSSSFSRKPTTSAPLNLKSQSVDPSPRKRTIFEEDFASDASSIDLPSFFVKAGIKVPPVPEPSKKVGTKTRRVQKNDRSGNTNKKFFN